MLNTIRMLILLMFGITVCGCGFYDEKLSVLKPGQRVVYSNSSGTMELTAGHDGVRYIRLLNSDMHGDNWLGDTAIVRLRLYDDEPGVADLRCQSNVRPLRFEGGYFKAFKHVKMKESRDSYKSLESVQSILAGYDEGVAPNALTVDGLYVYWSMVVPEYWIFPKQPYVRVEIKQLYINGENPENMSGVRSESVTVTQLSAEELAEFERLSRR